MIFKRCIFGLFLMAFCFTDLHAQCAVGNHHSSLTHELGLVAGPVVFKSDYQSENRVDLNNMGLGVGLVHYMNFSQGRDTYFNDHFKIRNEISYRTTKFEHHGPKVNDGSLEGKKLAAMHGKTKIWEIGTNLEWYMLGISRFQSQPGHFTPYLSLGIHFVHFSPEAESDLGHGLGTERSVTPQHYLAPIGEDSYINTHNGNTFSASGSLGVRYKLSMRSDLQLDLRAIYYGSDRVDGIAIKNSNYNDAAAWINLGYIYYFGL